MNSHIKNLVIFLLLFFTLSFTKVLVIVDMDYYQDCTSPQTGNRVDRYISDVENIDKKDVEFITFTNIIGVPDTTLCRMLWEIIRDAYLNSLTGDIIEGAVLIGDLPVPVFKESNFSDDFYPVEYFYMEVWDNRIPGIYNRWEDVWSTITLPNGDVYFDRSSYTGDTEFEIWVSRIYAKTIKHLRGDSDPWGTFLEEHQIIDQYLDRVYKRMNERAEVPRRGILMGHPTDFADYKDCEYWLGFKNLNLSSLRYFDRVDNTASNWQSQLQSGPYGKVSQYYFNGVLGDQRATKDCQYSEYAGDTRGYEWAGPFVHSGPNGHFFHWHKNVHLNGAFYSRTRAQCWPKEETGGYNGSYYKLKLGDLDIVQGEAEGSEHLELRALWHYIVKPGEDGPYNMYMYWKKDPLNAPKSYVNICRNFNIVQGTFIDQQNNGDNWEQINNGGTIQYDEGDTITIYYSSNYDYINPNPANDEGIADAVVLVNINQQGFVRYIDNEDDDFVLNLWNDRSFFSMRDDGGPSKAKFFVEAACYINSYHKINNLGLLYAMGHNGLIMLGNGDGNGDRFVVYTEALGNDIHFGEAYRQFVNTLFVGGRVYAAHNLFGAGTLQPKPYYHYTDYTGRVFNSEIFDYKYEDYCASSYIRFQNDVAITSNGSVKVTAGDEIVLSPEFYAAYGSEMHLKINPALKNVPPSL